MARPWRHPIKVALFTDTFDEISGVGHTFRRLAAHCRRHELPLDVFTVSPERTWRETDGSVVIHRIKPRIPLNYYPGLYLDLVPLADVVLSYAEDHKFDVIHVATPGHMGITGLYLATKHGLPLLGSYHTELPQYVSQRLAGYLDPEVLDDDEAVAYVSEVSQTLTWDYLACFYNHCERVLVPSEATRTMVGARLRTPLDIFPRGVDTQVFRPGERRGEATVRVLYVGRLAVEKNLAWLVRFGQRHPEVELCIVGDGPQRGELQAALPHATFTGFLQGEDLAAAYAGASLFAFPSLTETFGNVVLEAQAAGLPAVVSNQGGPQEIIEPGRTGLVAATAEEFETHLLTLLGDAERRRRMGKLARGRAEQRSWDEVFERLYSQYRSVKYPSHRRAWKGMLRALRESDSPWAVGLVAFWKQFGRRRAARAAAAQAVPVVRPEIAP